MIDKRPALIVRCATASDVVRALNFARDNGIVLAVRGGGHNIAGNAFCDDDIVIDLSQMKAASVDPGAPRLLHELKRFKDDVRRSIAPAALEAVQQPAIGQQ
jgi:FAD/FMN-containing dehydrogenase